MTDKNVDLVKEIGALLEIEASDDVAALLGAILAKVKALVSDEGDADAQVAAAAREALGLDQDAGQDDLVLALAVRDTGGAEVAAIREAEAERVAAAQVDGFVRANKLNPHDERAMSAAKALALEAPERLEALMANVTPYAQPGKTRAPDGRALLILEASREYRSDEGLQKSTSVGAYVNLALRDRGFDTMTPDEARDLPR